MTKAARLMTRVRKANKAKRDAKPKKKIRLYKDYA
jgi:hypothetical protein